MLNKFRTHHIKMVFWGLTLVIVPAFVMWGGSRYTKEKNSAALGEIAGRKISPSEFNSYHKMAQLQFMGDQRDAFALQAIKKTAWDMMVLNYKANKDRIKVTDKEVIEAIEKSFSFGGGFRKDYYFNFLKSARINPRAFEEYIRTMLRIDKVYEKYAKVSANENEARELYLKDTKKVKITYLAAHYDKLEDGYSPQDEETSAYYNNNKEYFRREAKAKIKYVVFPAVEDASKQMEEASASAKNIEEIADKLSLQVKATGYFGINETIPGLGMEPDINDYAFSLNKGEISEPISTDQSIAIIQKEESLDSSIPPFEEIKDAVKEKIKNEKAKEKAKKIIQDIFEKIEKEKITDLNTLAKENGITLAESDYFKYYEFTPEFSVDEKAKNAIFSLKIGQIYDKAIELNSGLFIVQLKDSSIFDEKDFAAKKKGYMDYITRTKKNEEKFKYLTKIKEETRLKVYSQYDYSSSPAKK